jgi:serine/threonine protein kinase
LQDGIPVSAKLCPQCGTRYEGDNRFCTLDGATLVLENPTDNLTGNLLADRYLVDRKLGEGGMGEVYLAEHIRMKRKVAVKVMRAWLTKDPAAIGRFHREAENASQITHPNVAGVYDFGETPDGLVYLAMEFVEGEPLTAILEREKILNHIRASDIVSQTADALAAAHSLGILHRDLKPDNVMIGRTRAKTDLVKLLDFGIARVMGRETQHFTSTGLIVGTPEWMSPEQIAGDKLDARSDIYTLGLIAFRMLTGEGAFSGVTSQEVLLAKMTKTPRRLHDVKGDVDWPDELQQAMDKVLATDPSARYDDALMFAADFYAGIARLPMTAAAEEYMNLLTQRAITPSRMGTVESTPVRGVPTHETPPRPMPRREPNVPQLADTAVLQAPVVPRSEADVSGAGAAVTGSGAAVPEITNSGVAIPTPPPMPSSEAAAPPRRRGPLLVAAGIALLAVVGYAVSQMGGTAAPPTTVGADSGAKVAVNTPDSTASATPLPPGTPTDSAGRAGAIPGVTPNSTTVAVRAAGPALDSAATRLRGSIFSIMRGRTRSTGFLADAEGLVLTSSAAVGGAPTVDVFLDGSRRVPGRVVLVDSARGLAALVVHTRHCPSTCVPLAIAPNQVQFKQGDSVMALTAPSLVSSGGRPKGSLSSVAAQRLSAALGVGEAGAGAPVLLPDGNVIGVSRAGGGRTANLVPASVARAFLRDAQQERRSKSIEAADSLLPSWLSQPISGSEIAAGVRRTSADLDAFRVPPRNDFVALVMTPQVLAQRKAEADTLRKYFNPGLSTTMFCDGNGPCDPLETWGGLSDYLAERRAVVVIQVAPQRTPPPFRGEHQRQDMSRRPVITQVEVARGNTVLTPIESHRIYSVVNPTDYPEGQRESLLSGLVVLNPNDVLGGGNLQIRIRTVGGRDQIRLDVPPSVLEAVRRDLASVIR